MVLSLDSKKVFEKIQYYFIRKSKQNVAQIEYKKNIPQNYKDYIRDIYNQHHTRWEKAKGTSPWIWNRTTMPTFACSSNIVLEALATVVREEKK